MNAPDDRFVSLGKQLFELKKVRVDSDLTVDVDEALYEGMESIVLE